MLTWPKFRLVVLAALLATLGYLAYSRGLGWRLGGTPAAIRGPYSTEEAWLVGEIVRDVAEMASFPARLPSAPVIQPVANQASHYRVSLPATERNVDLDLSQDLWSPESFAPLAVAIIGAVPATARERPAAHVGLLDLTPATLITSSTSISNDLTRDMRDPGLHEAAALTVGAFALRESAGRFYDVRWSLNRMTAHLAMAAALRSGGPATVDGRLAQAVLLSLANHQSRALSSLDTLSEGSPSDAVKAWARALRVRMTQDWRLIESPAAATRLEKLEYFRARRSVHRNLATEELQRLNVSPGIDWMRLGQAAPMGVEDGWLVTEALEAERTESADVFRQIHQREIAVESGEPLNARAVRFLQGDTPQVLPWGAWAEFSQRHLAMFTWRLDTYYRHMLGGSEGADAQKRLLKDELGDLSMFPLATIFWTKGPRGSEADLQYINEAIDFAMDAPERVTPTVWAFLETGSNYEAVRHGMPSKAGWFVPTAARAAYDAGTRLADLGSPLSPDAFSALIQDAPFDYGVGNEFLRRTYGDKPPYSDVLKVFKLRIDYDLRALRLAREGATEPDERIRLFRTSCEVASMECISLGAELVRQDRADEAALAYKRGLDDPSVDAVMKANSASWLVTYYFEHGQTAAALSLAEEAGGTGAQAGLTTQAYLYERLGRLEDAERVYRDADESYERPEGLIGFYYRAVNVRKQTAYAAALHEQLGRVFPGGLVEVSANSGSPATGVIVMKDSELSRAAGLQAGDIIIGLEGWRVDNLTQYRVVNAFFKTDRMKITAWRGRVFEVTVSAPNRLMGIEFRSHPIRGWGEN
jgi:hypothetical protein